MSALMMKKMSVTSVAWHIGKVRCCGAHFTFTDKPGINVDLEDPSNHPGIFRVVLYTRNCGSNSQRNKSVCPNIFRKHA
jgi:hypothetical protein